MLILKAPGRVAVALLVLSSAMQGQVMQLKEYDTVNAPRFGQSGYMHRLFNNPDQNIKIADPIKLKDYVVDGKLQLSLRSYLELVLANNTNINLQKVLIQPQRNAIQRAFGIFDPFATARYQAQKQDTPTTNALEGATTLSQLSQPLNFGYNQTLDWGTQIAATFAGNRLSTNNSFANFNPAFNTNTGVQVTQPLLRGRGRDIVRIPIYLAQSRLKSAEFRLEDTIMRQLVQAENAYWDLKLGHETLKVQSKALELAKASLDRARQELSLGAISELEIFQPEATYERARIFVTQAEYRLQQLEDALRLQMAVDLDPEVRGLPIELTEPTLPPNDNSKFDKEALVAEAIAIRPDLRATRQELNVEDNLALKQAGNLLRPNLALIGSYTTQGRGGPEFRQQRLIAPGGPLDALSQMFGFNFPIFGATLQLNLPIRDRAAAAGFSDALVAKRVDLMQERQLQQQIRLEVSQAISQVENSRASVEIARIAADLAQKRVDAEQKRYDLGVTQLFFVLQAQQDLTQAQSELVNNSVQYRRNLLNLLLRTGKLLTERNVVIQ
jgi:outer membrane protein TolC